MRTLQFTRRHRLIGIITSSPAQRAIATPLVFGFPLVHYVIVKVPNDGREFEVCIPTLASFTHARRVRASH